MQVAKYWRRLDQVATDRDGRTYELKAWGGSLESEADAERQAAAKLERWLAKLGRGERLADYEYQMRELREELIEEIHNPSGELIGAITRNRYGALVLNAASVLIADMDAERPNLLTKLLGLFGRKLRDKNFCCQRVREFVESQSGFAAVVYETHSGLRAFFTHQDFDPAGEDSRRILTTLGCDGLYQKLCTAQKCYRARLTPKPWRCGATRPPRRFPRITEAERDAFERWRKDYEQKAARFAVCRRLETFGYGGVTENAHQLMEVHDRLTLDAAHSELA